MNIFDPRIELTGDRIGRSTRPTGVRLDLSGYAFARPPADGTNGRRRPPARAFRARPGERQRPAAIFELPVRYTEKTGSDATAFLAAGGRVDRRTRSTSADHVLQAGESPSAGFPRTGSTCSTPVPGSESRAGSQHNSGRETMS